MDEEKKVCKHCGDDTGMCTCEDSADEVDTNEDEETGDTDEDEDSDEDDEM